MRLVFIGSLVVLTTLLSASPVPAASKKRSAAATLLRKSEPFYLKKLKKDAQSGDAQAQYQLARIYEEGRGVDRDLAYALSWYEEAARNGFNLAERRLRSLSTP